MTTNNGNNWGLNYAACDKELPQLRAVSKVVNFETDARIPDGCRISGTLQLSGVIQIDGEIEGDIVSTGEIVIGETAIINSNISTRRIKASGQINGDIVAEERIELCRGACVKGNIYSPRVAIQDGVVFEGRCVMPSPECREVADVHNFSQRNVEKIASNEPQAEATAETPGYIQETLWKLEQ